MHIGLADAFVDHVLKTHGRAIPAHIHADLYKDSDDSGVLTDRSVTPGAHAAVGEDLSDRVLGGGAWFGVLGRAQRTDKNGSASGRERVGREGEIRVDAGTL